MKNKTLLELLQEQNELLKIQNKIMMTKLCKCPHDGVIVNCPIHGIDGIDRKYY